MTRGEFINLVLAQMDLANEAHESPISDFRAIKLTETIKNMLDEMLGDVSDEYLGQLFIKHDIQAIWDDFINND